MQSKEIATLQRELDIAQREAKLRASAYYGDAGTMLRDQARFAEDSRKEQDEINTKKQALDTAQANWPIYKSRPANRESGASSNLTVNLWDTWTFSASSPWRLLLLEWSDSDYFNKNDIDAKSRVADVSCPCCYLPGLQL